MRGAWSVIGRVLVCVDSCRAKVHGRVDTWNYQNVAIRASATTLTSAPCKRPASLDRLPVASVFSSPLGGTELVGLVPAVVVVELEPLRDAVGE